MYLVLHNNHANYQIKVLIIEQIMNDCNMSSRRCKKLNIPGALTSISSFRRKKNEIFKMPVLSGYIV